MVERHHEIFRGTAHKVRSQCRSEGISVTDREIIFQSCFAKNALLNIAGASPYKAVVGIVPNFLEEFEIPSTTQHELGPCFLLSTSVMYFVQGFCVSHACTFTGHRLSWEIESWRDQRETEAAAKVLVRLLVADATCL